MAEHVAAIGRAARDVPESLGHVFGYTNGNDASARDLRFPDGK